MLPHNYFTQIFFVLVIIISTSASGMESAPQPLSKEHKKVVTMWQTFYQEPAPSLKKDSSYTDSYELNFYQTTFS